MSIAHVRVEKDRPIRLGTNRKMFSSSSLSCVGRTAAPLPLMGCCEVAIVLCGRVRTISLAQRRHATCGACDCPGETESCQSRRPISVIEALAPLGMNRGLGGNRGVALVRVNGAGIGKERRVKQARATEGKKWCLGIGFEKLQ
jgi:hypothetical protein